MGKSSISLENWLRNKLQENEEMHDYAVSTDTVRCWIGEYNVEIQDSHTPTEPVIEDSSGTEFDTLQEGDWAILDGDEYSRFTEITVGRKPGILLFHNEALSHGLFKISYGSDKRQCSTPSEFIRRAGNTFKTK